MKLYLSIIIFAISLSVSAQQATNFGLFYLNNMQHNPAAVGTNNHDIKMFANFRYQYFTVTDKPYRTISASVEAKILKAKKSKHYFGVGGSFINDASGDGRYGVNLATIPIAYHIFFNDNNSLSLGVAPGLYQRTIQPGAFTWQHQWTGTEFNQGLPGEDVGNRVVDRFNLDAGLFFKHQTSITNKFYFGVSAGHILEQDLGFFAEDKLERRYV
ncbi:MAG TPA: PorP/SprF family type IX secretion system membrane protein, partial [Brumimicrobium sp.]|nr:PorP/SprF family type IX secretion system membrane protein [Brumimicrobium sp.]